MRSRLENSRTRIVVYLLGGAFWLGSIILGMSVLAKHEATPGVDSIASHRWPQDSKLHRNPNGMTLLMFAHPRCPCTRASLAELEDILDRRPNDLQCNVVFFEPADAGADWMNTDQVVTARSIVGVDVASDIDGLEAKRFSATTSGYTLLYDRSGNLVFSGGITMSRGHIGDNAGQIAVEKILAGESTNQSNTPVFGCSMQECKQ